MTEVLSQMFHKAFQVYFWKVVSNSFSKYLITVAMDDIMGNKVHISIISDCRILGLLQTNKTWQIETKNQ